MKTKKGITLIALIITIIVMLILVAVAINVAINGGLFGNARNASIKTEEKSILENLISMAVYSKEGLIDVDKTYSKILNEYGESNVSKSDDKVTIIGKRGTFNYKLTDTTIDIYKDEDIIETPYTVYIAKNRDVLTALTDDHSPLPTEGEEGYNKVYDMYVPWVFIGLEEGKNVPPFLYYLPGEPLHGANPTGFGFALKCSPEQIVSSITVNVNGETREYNNAFIGREVSFNNDERPYRVVGYMDNNSMIFLNPEYDKNDYEANENNVIIEYTSLDPILSFTKTQIKPIKSMNYNVYKNTVDGSTNVIALKPDYSKVFMGPEGMLESEYGQDFQGLEYFQDAYDCVKIDNYTAHMSNGTTKQFSNVIMTIKGMGYTDTGHEDGKPIGYIDGNNFVLLNSEFDDSNRDSDGYPAEYTTLEPSGVVYTKE